jgi:hypothetical protein
MLTQLNESGTAPEESALQSPGSSSIEYVREMAENEHRPPLGTQPISVTNIYNSSPSKFQPWMQVTGGIPPKARMCAVDYDCPEADSTHGIPKGNLLIMGNAPNGLVPKEKVWFHVSFLIGY